MVELIGCVVLLAIVGFLFYSDHRTRKEIKDGKYTIVR